MAAKKKAAPRKAAQKKPADAKALVAELKRNGSPQYKARYVGALWYGYVSAGVWRGRGHAARDG